MANGFHLVIGAQSDVVGSFFDSDGSQFSNTTSVSVSLEKRISIQIPRPIETNKEERKIEVPKFLNIYPITLFPSHVATSTTPRRTTWTVGEEGDSNWTGGQLEEKTSTITDWQERKKTKKEKRKKIIENKNKMHRSNSIENIQRQITSEHPRRNT